MKIPLFSGEKSMTLEEMKALVQHVLQRLQIRPVGLAGPDSFGAAGKQ
jgi:hypothetical protein